MGKARRSCDSCYPSQPGAILLLRYRVRAEGRFALLGSTISAHHPLGTLTRNRCPAPASVAGEEIPSDRHSWSAAVS
jgi:hypothetical protein